MVTATSVRALLAHARLLLDLLPATDGVLKALLAVPSQAELKAFRTMILSRQSLVASNGAKIPSSAVCGFLLLLGVLVHLGLRLRARALALQRRAAFEHVIAGISTRLIDAQPQRSAAQIELALAELAEFVDADRAYLMRLGHLDTVAFVGAQRRNCVSTRLAGAGPGVRALFVATPEGIIHVPSVDRLPAGARQRRPCRRWPARLGVRLEVGSVRRSVAMLGFDALRPGIITRSAS